MGNHLLPGVSVDPEARKACASDFGRIITRLPRGVATPQSVEEVARLVRRASSDGVPLTIRGGAHSQGGQTLTDDGVVLDTSGLDRMQPAEPGLVRARGGTQWGKLVDALRGTRQLPRVLTDIGEVTVGGTLSVGGIGTTSHRYGLQVGQVERLEVVTGTGERVRCSAERNRDLFDAVRGGQGQFGVITEAWIRLRPAGGRFRQYELRYRDADRVVDDLETILDEDRFDHLRVEGRIHEGEIILFAGLEYDEDPGDARQLEGLGHAELAYTRDTANVGRGQMYPPWAFSRMHFHPWRDWFMPWEALRAVLGQPWLDPSWLPRRPGSWTGVYPARMEGLDAPLCMRPSGERILGYSVLALVGQNHYERATDLVRRLEEVAETLVGLGGKSYLSGRVRYGPRRWKEHYGEMLERGRRWKREFDPKQVFQRQAMPFGDGATSASR